jgi:hypothetical protein
VQILRPIPATAVVVRVHDGEVFPIVAGLSMRVWRAPLGRLASRGCLTRPGVAPAPWL